MENVLNVTNETRQALAQLNIETIPDLMDESYDTINSLEYYYIGRTKSGKVWSGSPLEIPPDRL